MRGLKDRNLLPILYELVQSACGESNADRKDESNCDEMNLAADSHYEMSKIISPICFRSRRASEQCRGQSRQYVGKRNKESSRRYLHTK
jgi:hypothetical protein